MPTPRAGYYNKLGKRVSGVTTIMSNFKNPAGLMYWSADIALEVLREVFTLLTDYRQALITLKETNKLDKKVLGRFKELDAFLESKPLNRANYKNEQTKATGTGTLAHELIHLHTVEGEPTHDHSNKDAFLAYQNGMKWWNDQNLKIISAEEQLISEFYNYGGTYDALAQRKNKKLVLIDYKTNKKLYSDVIIQCGAYVNLLHEAKGLWIDEVIILHVSKETGMFKPVHLSRREIEEGWEIFKKFLILHEDKKKLDKMI